MIIIYNRIQSKLLTTMQPTGNRQDIVLAPECIIPFLKGFSLFPAFIFSGEFARVNPAWLMLAASLLKYRN